MNSFIVFLLGLASVRAAEPTPPTPVDCEAGLDARGRFAARFLEMPDRDLPAEIARAYPDVLALTGEVDASPFGAGLAAEEGSLASERLFGRAHPEFDRTLLGLLVLKWVMTGDYERLVSVQPAATRLGRARFDEIRARVAAVVPDLPSLDAMIASMVINDLGKARAFVEDTRRRTGTSDVDHDSVLLAALEKTPESIGAFARLAPGYRKIVIAGLRAKFNLGQFVQGENAPPSLEGMRSLVGDARALEFFLVHALIDFAGVAGHKTQAGSLLLDEPKATAYLRGIEALAGLAHGRTPVEVYRAYFASRAGDLNLPPDQLAPIRLATMLGASTPAEGALVLRTLRDLPSSSRVILEHELNVTGYDDQPAILVYYAPAIVTNVRNALVKAGESPTGALTFAFEALARAYHEARLARPAGSRVFTVMAKSLADLGGTDPRALDRKTFEIVPVGEGAELRVRDSAAVDVSALETISRPPPLGGRLGYVGIGGGSDGIQAAILALMMRDPATKTPPFVISVRSPHPLEDHGGEIAPGAFRVLPRTTAPSRFLENRPAAEVTMYEVFDGPPETVRERLRAVMRVEGRVDHLIAVDTGGDSLTRVGHADSARATPDRDLRVLHALAELHLPTTTAIVAPGVDAPDDATEILRAARARHLDPNAEQTLVALRKYREWGLDGRDPSAFGKTLLAWQAALWSEFGRLTLPIPARFLLDRENPWSPYVHVRPSLRGIAFMALADHLQALGITKPFAFADEHLSELRRATHGGGIMEVFEHTLHWRPSTLDEGRARRLTNPYFESQGVVLQQTYPGAPFTAVSAEEIEDMIATVARGETFVFAQARELVARAGRLEPDEIRDLLAQRRPLHDVLRRKGWTIEVLRRGRVFEYGDGWYEADWVSRMTSPDGSTTVTEARDFVPYRPEEVEKIARALASHERLVTDRARAALGSASNEVPGDNPRARIPPRD